MNNMIIPEIEEILKRAREKFGTNSQLLVCIEELNELACVLCKFPRYDDPQEAIETLFDKALDEVADVNIILEHIYAIFGFTREDVENRIAKKTVRISRWVKNGETMQETINDRKV